MTVSPSGKAMDCKSFIPQFKSGYCLIRRETKTLNNLGYRGRGGMVDTTDLKSVD
jgi:hypothetical protein